MVEIWVIASHSQERPSGKGKSGEDEVEEKAEAHDGCAIEEVGREPEVDNDEDEEEDEETDEGTGCLA